MITPVALTIAGSDPSGGAGIQADLKVFHQFGVYGEAVLTLLTVQNTTGVTAVEILSPGLVAAQLTAVVEDIPPGAAKTGALGSAEMVECVAAEASRFPWPLVVDPVMISKHGAPLMAEQARAVLIGKLIPAARLLTPNLHEAEAITGRSVASLPDMREAGKAILGLGAKAVLIKGGHLEGEAVDLLLWENEELLLEGPRIDTPHTHGTGCSYSAAITALLARQLPLPDAVSQAKRWIQQAIATNPGLGHGQGPVNHFTPAR